MRISKVLGLIAFTMTICIGASPPSPGEPKYEFTRDWVSKKENNWDRVLAEFKGKANVHALEIGSFEGRSAIWFLDNILTDPTSTLTCVDVFTDEIEANFDHKREDVGEWRWCDRVPGLLPGHLAGPRDGVL